MLNPAVAYTQRPDTGAERELSALANVYRLILDSAKQRGRLPDKSGPDDEKERFRKMTLSPQTILQHSPLDTSFGFRRCCQAIRDAVLIEDVARRYTDIEPFGGKAWFTGRCALPDHEDKTASFYIYPPDRWWCYGCGRGGDVVDLEFQCGEYGELWEAMISLAVEYDVKLPERPPSWFRRQERQRPMRDVLEEVKVKHVQRRLFRIFAPTIEQIEDETERKAEKAEVWNDLRRTAALVVAGRRTK